MAILIGTSGFSYDDWRGHFYPEGLPKKDMLAYYASQFPAVEINSTYYGIPRPHTFVQMLEKTPRSFGFVVKAHRDMTHADEFQPEVFEQFRRAIEPLVEEGALGCVLGQFPWSFRKTPENEAYLTRFRDELQGLPAVVEFRNHDWVADGTFDRLRNLGLGFCCVDEPQLKGLMPPITVATSPVGYVRFHGRNAAKWWKHEHAWERYNYLYTEAELEEWAPRIESLVEETERTYVFFNNHYEGRAGQNARMLARLLNLTLPMEQGPAPVPTLDL